MYSSLLSFASERTLGLRTQFICGYDKNGVWNSIWNVYYFEISPLFSLTECNPRIFPTAQVLSRSTQDTFNFVLRNIMFIDVRKPCRRINVVTDFHSNILNA